MTAAELVRRRWRGLVRAGGVVDVVRGYGAMQAQDYLASLWAIGARSGAVLAEVEAALVRGEVVRTHALRNTIHMVAREDLRWMLALTGERMWQQAQPRYRELGLDAKTLVKAEKIFAAALGDGEVMTRAALAARLTKDGVAVDGQRMPHLLHHAELRGLVCGAGKAFAWLDRVVPAAAGMARDDAAAALARRYFAWRGPASGDDFAWWSGLAAAEARAAVAAVAAEYGAGVMDGVTYYFAEGGGEGARARLLPAFDEYTVAYRDRSALGDGLTGFQMLAPVLVIDGRVAATWKRVRAKDRVDIAIAPVRTLAKIERAAIDDAAACYGKFLGLSPRVKVAAAMR